MSFPYHPLINPNKGGATTEQNHVWIAAIREMQPGEDRLALINTMIEANIPLVFVKLKTFVQLFPGFKYLWDDMVAEGLLALTEGVHRLGDMSPPGEDDVDNPTGYVGVMIVRRVGRMLDDLTRALPGHSAPYILRNDGTRYSSIKEAATKCHVDIEDIAGVLNTGQNIAGHTWKQVLGGSSYTSDRVVDPRGIVEERDLLEASCESDIDRTIIRMREWGNNQSEIADALELSQSSISVFLHDIKTRYDALVAETM